MEMVFAWYTYELMASTDMIVVLYMYLDSSRKGVSLLEEYLDVLVGVPD